MLSILDLLKMNSELEVELQRIQARYTGEIDDLTDRVGVSAIV